MKKLTKQTLAGLLAGVMLLSLAACGGNVTAEAPSQSESVPAAVDSRDYPLTPEELGSGEVKWSEEKTDDGWVKVTNENGETLGYSPESGVSIIQVDGYAFKDLNQNGLLDLYEDWRQSNENRAKNVVSLMSIQNMAGVRVNPGVMSLNSNGETSLTIGENAEESTVETYITEYGLRYLLSYPHAGMGNFRDWKVLTEWSNKMQLTAESSGLGLPVIINSDRNNVLTNSIYDMGAAATFDTEAVNKLYQEVSKSYRAIGVTMMLSPQVDLITDPRTQVVSVFTEDPQLAADMTDAVINGMQSTYDEDGNDLGWGADSVICQMKHFTANNSVEGGRSYHGVTGKYTVFPGDAFETQLIPYVDGGFSLTGKTGQTGALMLSYTIAWSDDGSLGDKVASAMSSYVVGLAKDYGFEGMISTDGLRPSTLYDYDGSTSSMTAAEQVFTMFSLGVDQLMSSGYSFEDIMEAYDMLVAENGEDAARANFEDAAYDCVLPMFQTELVENPYCDVSESVTFLNNATYTSTDVTEMAQSGIVMLKNSNDAIHAASEEKETVYVPYVNTAAGWALPASERMLEQYFNLVTDTVDADGNVVRASAKELADCDKALVFIESPSTGGGYDDATGEYIPISLQYSEYTANSEYVRETSIAGDLQTVETETPYGIVTTTANENRSYYGKSTVATNIADMELVQEVAGKMPESADVVVCVNSAGAMIFSEIEPYADAILVVFGNIFYGNTASENFIGIAAGEVEPNALLPIQMPANMETVEAQCEDVPRDMECYVDADGNTYDFGFGLNWSGVIQDARTEKYCVPALTEPATQPVR